MKGYSLRVNTSTVHLSPCDGENNLINTMRASYSIFVNLWGQSSSLTSGFPLSLRLSQMDFFLFYFERLSTMFFPPTGWNWVLTFIGCTSRPSVRTAACWMPCTKLRSASERRASLTSRRVFAWMWCERWRSAAIITRLKVLWGTPGGSGGEWLSPQRASWLA